MEEDDGAGDVISLATPTYIIGLASPAALDVSGLVEALQFQAPTAAQTNLLPGK